MARRRFGRFVAEGGDMGAGWLKREKKDGGTVLYGSCKGERVSVRGR
jgi:hypothetical protein